MMDCDTTGVEPDIALIKYKKLVGEGFLKIVNQTVPAALRKLGYGAEEVDEILAYLTEHETIEGAPHLKPQHLPVFDCAFKPANGERSIHYMGHVRMMGAIQPFISRRDQQDRQHARGRHRRGDREGLPRGLEARPQGDRGLPRQLEAQPAAEHRQEERRRRGRHRGRRPKRSRSCGSSSPRPRPRRHSPIDAGSRPSARRSPTSSTSPGHEGYITVGLYPDGQPGEIFLKMAKEGSTVSGLMDSFATTVSVALQYGVPLKDLVNKFAHVRFEPSGLHRQPGDPDRQVDHRLHLPLARLALPVARRQGEPRTHRSHRGRGGCPGVLPGLRHGRLARGEPPQPSPDPAPTPASPPPASVAPRAHRRTHRRRPPSPPNPSPRRPPSRWLSPWPSSPPTAPCRGQRSRQRQRERQDHERQRRRRSPDHPQPRCQHQGQLPDPGRRPQLHGLRLDHGPQRQSATSASTAGAPAAAADAAHRRELRKPRPCAGVSLPMAH